ncbi:MAG TPA: hypothetical protein VG672_03525 [Bryobacteraceae bacterium]|nr:hypothetical protein [Bryobacteraceae bacterium]
MTRVLYLTWAIIFIAAGTLLRIADYARCASGWEDEISLIVSFLDRGYGELVRPLSSGQVAPVGFLLIEKFLQQVFGASEYSLRLFPVLTGIAALPLVWIAARKLIGPWPALLALALVSFSPSTLRHSAEVKQYGVELFVTAGLLVLAAYSPQRLTVRRAVLLTFAGIVAISLSNPALYVLAGFGLLLVLRAFERRAPAAEWMMLAGIGTVWLGFFGAVYVLLFAPTLAPGAYMDQFWGPTMLNAQSSVAVAARLVLDGILHPVVALDGRVGLPLYVASAVLFLAGAIAAARKRELVCLCLFPLLLALGAALAGKYNFSPRLMTYAIPLVSLLMANALSWAEPLAERSTKAALVFVGFCLVFVLLPVKADVFVLRHEIQSFREGVQFALQQHRTGDAVYLYSRSVPGWMYYSTDWRHPDYQRLAWLAEVSRLTGPNGGNRPSRNGQVQNEGAEFHRPYRGGWELVGVGEGIFRSSIGEENHPPDPGWVENEYARMARDSRSGRVILIGFTPGAHGVVDLLDYCRSQGAEVVANYRGPGAVVAVLELRQEVQASSIGKGGDENGTEKRDIHPGQYQQ